MKIALTLIAAVLALSLTHCTKRTADGPTEDETGGQTAGSTINTPASPAATPPLPPTSNYVGAGSD